MSRLLNLKSAQSLRQFAYTLGCPPKLVSFVLYKIPNDRKYKNFTIPKKAGGCREIHAPISRLKGLQRELANLLYDCNQEILNNRDVKIISHGFKRGYSIATNAKCHANKRYVLNLDIKDFFPSINFGRVRGFFLKNKNFKLHADVATVIAQLACHDNCLPQGSPSSPVISDMVASMLDVKLIKLAKQYKCTYSRYADDITISTNQKKFPKQIAKKKWGRAKWIVSKELENAIVNEGFSINYSKVRMQYKSSRQVVTGLVVNKKVNIKHEYYRSARSMCHSLFNAGDYHLPKFSMSFKNRKKNTLKRIWGWVTQLFYFKTEKTSDAPFSIEDKEPTINVLEGILSHIYFVKRFSKESGDKRINGIKNLYAKFLLYKHFYALEKPLILCEGKTDNIYLRCALRQLYSSYPKLIAEKSGKTELKIKFFNFTNIIHEVLELASGSGAAKYLIPSYERLMKPFSAPGLNYPVILLLDNDDEAKKIFSIIKEVSKSKKDIDGSKPYYYIAKNLYVIFIPKLQNKPTIIEDFFDQKVLQAEVEGKKLSLSNGRIKDMDLYSKAWFAEKVIQANQSEIDFKNFAKILDRIQKCVEHYDKS